MLKFIIIALLLSPTCKICAQIKEYKLLDKTADANINPHLLNILDTSRSRLSLLDNAFKPVKGTFTVYRFIATFEGTSFTNKQKKFHDILIAKTNRKNKIISAYQYTLEWADAPDADLYVKTAKGNYLTNNMAIDNFMFERIFYDDKANRKLKEHAVIKLE